MTAGCCSLCCGSPGKDGKEEFVGPNTSEKSKSRRAAVDEEGGGGGGGEEEEEEEGRVNLVSLAVRRACMFLLGVDAYTIAAARLENPIDEGNPKKIEEILKASREMLRGRPRANESHRSEDQ